MYTYMYMYLCINKYISMNIYQCVFVCLCVCMCMCVYVCVILEGASTEKFLSLQQNYYSDQIERCFTLSRKYNDTIRNSITRKPKTKVAKC